MADNQLRIVISYSHEDEDFVDEFRKHLAPLKNNDIVDDWYDRKIIPGREIEENFFNNLKNTDICCLFISANFLNSKACMKEKNRAFELKKNKGLDVVPIIVSRCGWLDDEDIEPILALPEDGEAITKFEDRDDAWMEVYDGIKVVIDENTKLKEASLTKAFKSFLQDTELLKKAHPEKEEVKLDDIFVYPDLEKYDELRDAEKEMNTEDLLENFTDYSKILIAGEDQSSKTTLGKVFFSHLRDQGFFPVYINDRENEYRGKTKNKLSSSFDNQYKGIDFNELDKKKLVPILDDFHYANNKEKIVTDLQEYKYQVLIVDDVFSLNFKEENLIKSYDHFKIKEFKPSLRNKIIKKWISLTDKKNLMLVMVSTRK